MHRTGLTQAQRETLRVAATFGTGRSFTEHQMHVRATEVIPGYTQRLAGQQWHGRLLRARKNGWVTRRPAPKGHDVWGSRWLYTLTDEGDRAADAASRAIGEKRA